MSVGLATLRLFASACARPAAVHKRGFELIFRVYGPTKEFFGKTWVLPATEKVAVQ